MRAGFLRRLGSSLVDLMIVIIIVYLAFTFIGNPYLSGRIENFDEINENLTQVQDAYDLSTAQINQEYDDAKELAGDDQEAVDAAYLVYREKVSILNQHYAQDTSVYQRLLYDYNVGTIYFYAIGIGLLLGILVLSFKGLTPGRKLMKLELVGQVSMFHIITHDLLLKYMLVIVLVLITPYFALMLVPAYFIIDLLMIMLSKDKTTIRDRISKIIVNIKDKEIKTISKVN